MFIISFYRLAIISPFRRAWLFIWKTLNFLYPRLLYAKFGWNWPCNSEVEFFLIILHIFLSFCYYPPWGRVWAFICKNLNSIYHRVLCAMFGSNEPSGSGEDFFNIFNRNLLFCNYLLLQEGVALNLDKLEFPPAKDALCQVWLKLVQWFWRRRFQIF